MKYLIQLFRMLFAAVLLLSADYALAQSDCAKNHYSSHWDMENGPVISGQKATYHYYEIPWNKVIQIKDSLYKIIHPNFSSECSADTLVYVDKKKIILDAEQGDKYNIAVVMMYLDKKPQKVFVCPWHDD